MCLLIFKKAGATIPVDNLCEGLDTNSDGAGFAIPLADRGLVYVDRGVWKFKEFLDRYNAALEYFGGSPACIVHFRWSTGGKVNTVNCHPFPLTKAPFEDRGYAPLALAHNGVLSEIKACDKFSDTHHLASQLSDKWSIRKLRKVLHKHSGPNNKFTLVTPNNTWIIGEEHGHWSTDKGVWYSNNSYMPCRFTTYTHQGKQYQYYYDGVAGAWDDTEDIEFTYAKEMTEKLTCNDRCLYCEKDIGNYRLGNTDILVCWDCKKAWDDHDVKDKGLTIPCSFCGIDQAPVTRYHYCSPHSRRAKIRLLERDAQDAQVNAIIKQCNL